MKTAIRRWTARHNECDKPSSWCILFAHSFFPFKWQIRLVFHSNHNIASIFSDKSGTLSDMNCEHTIAADVHMHICLKYTFTEFNNCHSIYISEMKYFCSWFDSYLSVNLIFYAFFCYWWCWWWFFVFNDNFFIIEYWFQTYKISIAFELITTTTYKDLLISFFYAFCYFFLILEIKTKYLQISEFNKLGCKID